MEKGIKPGWKTTEFWMTSVTVLLSAIVALFVGYGVLSQEQGSLWLQLLVAVAGLAIPAYVVARYGQGRAQIKSEALWVEQEKVNNVED